MTGVLAALLLAPAVNADPAGQITEVATGGVTAGFTLNSGPTGIVAGPDGNLWFTESSGRIGRITPAGTVTEFATGLTANSGPFGITAGPDGNLWFTELNDPGRIGRITPGAPNTITEFTTGLTVNSGPTGITAGPDGNLWFTEGTSPGQIGRITPAGVITEFSTVTVNSGPAGITAGPDGNLWFTEQSGATGHTGAIGRITPGATNTITEFTTGLTDNSGVDGITAGPDGNVWFTEQSGVIGRITPAGVITEFSTGLTANSLTIGITAGCGGNLWFTEARDPGRIGRITPAGVITEFSTGLTANSEPDRITAGPDGNLWFTEQSPPGGIAKIGAGCTAPGAPTAVQAVAGTAKASVSWSAPASDGGGQITAYTVTSSPGGQTCSWTTGPLSCVVSGLSNGTSYTFRVVATNVVGPGPASLPSSAVVPHFIRRLPAGLFSTPTGHRRSQSGVLATAGKAEATVQFPAAGAGSGAPATSYTVTASPGGATAVGTTSPITVTGLNNGTRYTFTVTAIETSGRGATSSQSNEVVPEARTAAARLTRGAASAPRPGGGIPWMTPLMGVLLCALLVLGCLVARSRRRQMFASVPANQDFPR